ncbi:MAG: tetratricopeptide repeat protein [Silicimonas sp.]|nr:tetratricopeptide repeat protein [Silicimonas sp.]NNF90423.1 tetratricopeptide repeat protein [Boseongicola sp.]NND19761.1 tetratricopeptide repeat protein [Silicimonas sp.]NND22993.1 tetratricopeptide repeat protein [Silicimonas sp.]NND41285.1 tetratricopeptide repeat protein [Silicimonas sp.]
MGRITRYLKCAVAAFAAALSFQAAWAAENSELEALLEGLKTADPSAVQQIEGRIYEIWADSGSPSMDLLLERGLEALEAGETTLAIEHLTALVDHAPEFAEGYNARATAYFQNGQFGPSLADIRQTLTLNPRHFRAMTGLALILEEIGRPEDSLAAWREVQKINPSQTGLNEAITRLERQVEGQTL